MAGGNSFSPYVALAVSSCSRDVMIENIPPQSVDVSHEIETAGCNERSILTRCRGGGL